MKHLLRTLAFASQILAARRTAVTLMSEPSRVWPEPGRPVEDSVQDEKPPRVVPSPVETPVYGPDVLLSGDDVEWFTVSGCVCSQFGTRHLVCPAHGDDRQPSLTPSAHLNGYTQAARIARTGGTT